MIASKSVYFIDEEWHVDNERKEIRWRGVSQTCDKKWVEVYWVLEEGQVRTRLTYGV